MHLMKPIGVRFFFPSEINIFHQKADGNNRDKLGKTSKCEDTLKMFIFMNYIHIF